MSDEKTTWEKAEISTNQTIVEMSGDIRANEQTGETNAKDIALTQQQLIAIGNILMQPPARPDQ